jgi:myo-inositol catabolism protein IolS
MNRRSLLSAATILIGGGAAATWFLRDRSEGELLASGIPAAPPHAAETRGEMPYRAFGSTGLKVSEVSFGSWGIGGRAYGPVQKLEALNALARADEHGCNLVDTAAVYGESETLLGEFLHGRRDRWLISTKYSEQPAGMTKTLEEQLQRLKTDRVDIYLTHWAPGRDEAAVYDELYALKKAGKVRFVGVSLKNATDIDYVIDHTNIDGLMVAFSLLDPDPFLARVERLRASGKAVMVRSSLREGFLTGKFKRDVTFTDPTDQRSSWSAEQVARVVDNVERFRFLEAEAGSMVRAAVAYPLSFPEVSTVVLGSTSTAQADSNFGQIPGSRLSEASLKQVVATQVELDLFQRERLFRRLLRTVRGR